MENLLRHLVFLARNFSDFSERNIVEILLIEAGVSTKRSAFNYLVDSVLLYGDAECKSITKVIFPEIAKKNNVEKKAVEKAVERAVHDAWKTRDEVWTMFFLNEERVTSSEFISRMAIILELWKSCCRSAKQKEGSK